MSFLKLSNISAFYGPSQALFDVHLTLEQGEVLALMGRNGMGKTTTVGVITRLVRQMRGTLVLDGRNLVHLPAFRVARLGIGLVPEGRRCFGPLTVRENLIAAARPGEWDLERVFGLFERLGERLGQSAATLSGGEQQMLAIGRALMTNPRLLILDEATEGLAPVLRREIWAALRRLKAETGLGIIVVDKSIRELAGIADKAVILEKGRSVWSGRFSDLDGKTTQRYLGV